MADIHRIRPRSAIVVGAGIVGLSTAWFLQDRGVSVTVVDRTGVAAGASWGNAGWIAPALSRPAQRPANTAIRSAVIAESRCAGADSTEHRSVARGDSCCGSPRTAGSRRGRAQCGPTRRSTTSAWRLTTSWSPTGWTRRSATRRSPRCSAVRQRPNTCWSSCNAYATPDSRAPPRN